MIDEATGHLKVDGARLYHRRVGSGPPIVVLHGGPEFDHTYLLPELDVLADEFTLLYYDQRGRGRSADRVRPEDVTIDTEITDLEALRTHLDLGKVALLGHSWGGLLAMEYASRHPDHVSHLILMNTAPGSHSGRNLLAESLARVRTPEERSRLEELRGDPRYRRGSIAAETEYHLIHFRPAFARPERLPIIVSRLRTHFTPETVLLARQIEERLSRQSWVRADYDVVSRLTGSASPTLVVHSDRDFIPGEIAIAIADSLPTAQLVVLTDSGHFGYMEQTEQVREVVTDFMMRT